MPSDSPTPKRRGRPPGFSPGPLGPRVGSNVWALSRLDVGETMLVEVGEPGVAEDLEARQKTTAAVFAHWQTYFPRVGGGATFTSALWLAVNPKTREVLDVIRITRLT